MIYALILGLSLGLAAALISPFLVLNHQSMIADGLSHVAFAGIIFGLLLFDEPIYFALPFVIGAAFLITYLGNLKMISHDASIGVVSAFSLAIGLIAVTLSSGFNRSIESLLVGSILTVTLFDVLFSVGLFLLILSFVLIFYRPLLSITYDSSYAKIKGIKYNFLRYGLSAITAAFIVIGIRSTGMLLISAFIIFPSLIASQFAKSFRQTITFGLILSLITIFIGITFAYHLDIPVGSSIVVIYTVILIAAIGFRKILKEA
jgi:zinc transport system permease protein